MTSQQELIQEKQILMNQLLNQLLNWDQSTEEALRILRENNETIELMCTVDVQLTEAERLSYNETHQEVWRKIIEMQKILNQFIQTEKNKTKEQLVQIGNKEKIVSNYIDIQKETGFIKRNY